MKANRTDSWRRVRRAAFAVAGLAAAFVGVVGFAHTEAGRPWLAYLPGMGTTCPVGMDAKLTLEQRDRLRAQTLANVRGAERAGARPALGFALDETKEAEVLAWAARLGIACEQRKGGAQVRCRDVPAGPLGDPAVAVLFSFDAAHELVAVDATREFTDAAAAARAGGQLSDRIARAAGPVTTRHGAWRAEHLAGGALNQTRDEYRFVDYRARVGATNMGAGRFVVREQYQSLTNGS